MVRRLIGRWEGDTLVVDTTNFTDKTAFQGSGEALHVVERFTRVDADTILYEFTLDDPTTWERPWSAEIPMVKTGGRLFEYTCHEGELRYEEHAQGCSRGGQTGGGRGGPIVAPRGV